eukprot:gene15482-biopygen4293
MVSVQDSRIQVDMGSTKKFLIEIVCDSAGTVAVLAVVREPSMINLYNDLGACRIQFLVNSGLEWADQENKRSAGSAASIPARPSSCGLELEKIVNNVVCSQIIGEKILRRSFILFCLGLFLNSESANAVEMYQWRVPGVLQV